uniref:NADH-ubiquinone oxidoreductase chain 4L n=1 Tax=Pyrearinus termitilluminans TaxID=109589 RepID=A0A158V4K2_9COLE|nr:NADH dehydrogenase subunit 4L [Pyrearinus termitilluminans]AIQ80131.1 NADH dehydrogenase subunit 4L [Pyrearinus termitilluminans]
MTVASLVFPLFIYFVGVGVFCLKCKHLLLMLLSLEFVVLSLYLGLYLGMIVYGYEYYFVMVFLTISVCEGALGLSVLVSMIRSYGNDYFQSFSVLW